MRESSKTLAVLGPTNTGKTHYAIERMLAYRTGVMGLPLRLLAREVYDKIVALRGPSIVALVTGEERIVPKGARYWVCTVEAMPQGTGADFVAVDEIQLSADPDRGHVFTDRLLNMRGTRETQFLGSLTMQAPIASLIPEIKFIRRERMSQLNYIGPKKISKMRPRSAVVGFSVDNVYAMAELLRRLKGGAAVVMGALSPRTRNAQVEMYQNGDVDCLVATDAIGMGLNLDIDHVAFSGLVKFDGRRMRNLAPSELAQIAGRAGRGMSDGTFGVTGDAPELAEATVKAIAGNRFSPVRRLQWRSNRLEFTAIDHLVASLETRPDNPILQRASASEDLTALKALADMPRIRALAGDVDAIKLLWQVCRIPDYRKLGDAGHAELLSLIYLDLHKNGRLREDLLSGQIKQIDRTQGDIDALSKRLAFVRTWTYVAQNRGWVENESHWRGVTRAVEDRLSDALHIALTRRFVDRRTSVLMRRLKQKEAMVAEVDENGVVTVEGEFTGRLEGFRFIQDGATGREAKAIRQSSLKTLAPHFNLRADRFYNASDTEISLTEQGGFIWNGHAVGRLVAGKDAFKPEMAAFVDDAVDSDVKTKVERRLRHYADRKISKLFEPLLNMRDDSKLSGSARGFAFRLLENFGIVPRDEVVNEVRDLDQDTRAELRGHGVRFGQYTIFMPLLLKPAPTQLRLILWSLKNGVAEFPQAPPPGLVTVPADVDGSANYHTLCGYHVAGSRAVRIDMLERLADMLRNEDRRGGFEANPDMLSITGMTLDQFAELMRGLGYNADRGEREKPGREISLSDQNTETSDAAKSSVDTSISAKIESDDGSEIKSANLPPDSVQAKAMADTEVESPAGAGAKAENIADDPMGEPDVQVYYTFAWAGHRKGGETGKKRAARKGRSRGGQKKPNKIKPNPEKREKIDMDNPFAAALFNLNFEK